MAVVINNITIKPGERVTIDIPVADLYTRTPLTMPVQIIAGRKPGPVLFISAAIHGDEINGVEIIRQLLKLSSLKNIKGTLIAVPIVNVFGFLHHDRYLPDRRDLNRSFPGSGKGSLAARLADLFIREIVQQSTHGIDLHTASSHRTNLPQIRAHIDDEPTRELAEAFGAPVILNSDIRDGSLRQVAADMKIPMLLYEAGEALRFDDFAIHVGLRGIINVMRKLDMLPKKVKSTATTAKKSASEVARSSSWVRAPISGILRKKITLGEHIKKEDVMGVISDPFGAREQRIYSPAEGILIGATNLPLVNEGDALFHIARFGKPEAVVESVEYFNDQFFGDDQIIN